MMKIKVNKEKGKFTLIISGVILIGLIAFLFFNHYFSFAIPCPFHKLTGLYCPGCGITRMILSILQLDFYQAFRYNAFLMILLPFALVYGILYFTAWIQDRQVPRLPNIVWNILLIAAIAFMIIRNIPLFSFLAPTVIA